MTQDDKEFILSVLDDITTVLAIASTEFPEQDTKELWNKIARATLILERSLYSKAGAPDDDDTEDTMSRQEPLDFSR